MVQGLVSAQRAVFGEAEEMTIRADVLYTAEEYMTRDPAQVAEILGKPVEVIDCAMRALKRDGRLQAVAKPRRKKAAHRYGKGETHPSAVLTEHDIRLIRQLVPELHARRGSKMQAYVEAAGKFDISPSHVVHIVHGWRWGHVQ